MAIYRNPNLMNKMTLQPGARGEKFDGNRINRTNYTLNTSEHVATNSKYGMDDRLAIEFKYGYAAGFNQMLITKGRIVAIDPYLNIFDADTQKYDNALTLANGGVDVELVDGHWVATSTPFVLDPNTEKDTTRPETCRPANVPIGVLIRNEYSRDIDAFNGITPGAVNTNCMTELPLFLDGAKAKENPWGSAYGALKPGDLVKADTTGRVTISPLSTDWVTAEGRTAGEIELERQQVIGQVYEVRKELVPMGAAKYAQWALSDILEFEEFNPDLKRTTNRRGEDTLEKTPFPVDGRGPLGYESTFTEHDLHAMNFGTERQNYNKRMQHKYRFDFGIPGLTDGGNAVTRAIAQRDSIRPVAANYEFVVRFLDTNVKETSDAIVVVNPTSVDEKAGTITGGTKIKAVGSTFTAQMITGVTAEGADKVEAVTFTVTYIDALQGLMKVTANKAITKTSDITFAYYKAGTPGVPTNLDWDGCVGIVKVLLQK